MEGAQVTLHAFILMVDASYTGLAQVTDYSLRQLGSDGIPGGTVQSHVVRAGDTPELGHAACLHSHAARDADLYATAAKVRS